jgi:hypothetical protein
VSSPSTARTPRSGVTTSSVRPAAGRTAPPAPTALSGARTAVELDVQDRTQAALHAVRTDLLDPVNEPGAG